MRPEESVTKAERNVELLKEAKVLVDKLASMEFEITFDLKKSNTDSTNETELIERCDIDEKKWEEISRDSISDTSFITNLLFQWFSTKNWLLD